MFHEGPENDRPVLPEEWTVAMILLDGSSRRLMIGSGGGFFVLRHLATAPGPSTDPNFLIEPDGAAHSFIL